jgi:hypothetical protein
VIAPPNPSIVWNVCEGSTTTVGTDGWPVPNGTSPMSASLYCPSAVVSHRCAATGAVEWRAAAAEVSGADNDTPITTPR